MVFHSYMNVKWLPLYRGYTVMDHLVVFLTFKIQLKIKENKNYDFESTVGYVLIRTFHSRSI